MNKVLFAFTGDIPSQLPTRATDGAAGYDIYAALREPFDLHPGASVSLHTGFCVALPEHLAMQILIRSGLASKHGLRQGSSGLIDSDYRGEVMVTLHNTSKITYAVQPGERIAQAIFLPVVHPEIQIADSLPQTVRGDGGFGSTGRK